MISKAEQMKNREWEVGTIIKIVSNMNIRAVCKLARKFEGYTEEKLDKIDNREIYEEYCDIGAEEL